MIPCLNFTARDQWIKIQCNEEGFTEKEVSALCNVSKSTKNPKKTIGGRGIGFKSVFKVADEVHIGSNGFQFILSKKNGAFGMVQPKWRTFNDWSESPGVTLLKLSLSADCEASVIHEEIEDLKPTVLLFLRNLLEISIDTPGFRTQMSCLGRGEPLVTLKTTTRYHFADEHDDPEHPDIKDHQKSEERPNDSYDKDGNDEDDYVETQEFLVIKAEAKCKQAPPSGKSSTMSLAFPTVGEGTLVTQYVHAF